MSGELIARVTLDELLANRALAFKLAAEAREHDRLAREKVREAQAAGNRAAGGEMSLYHLRDDVISQHLDDKQFTKKVRARMDKEIWPFLLRHTGLAGMMDKTARAEFDRELAGDDPPECNEDNIRATFQQLKRDAYLIFRRGVVEVFRNLAREYRSHDGFKLGPRTVISRGVSSYGDYHTFADADRIMHVLDDARVGPGWYSTLAERLRSDAKTAWDGKKSVMQPGEITTPYWRAKWFQNENCHLWCLRPDLLRRANRLIAEHYEDAIGAGPDAAGARRYERAKPYHSEVEDFYATQEPVVARMIDAAKLRLGMEVLEPSAGEGAIVAGILAEGCYPDCVERDSGRASILRDMLLPGCVIEMDFLKMLPDPVYDRVLMNPPFGKGAGVAHVFHAMRFLKPGGRLVAILGVGMEYRTDGPTKELRNRVEAWGGTMERLPAGSFKGAGTSVDTVLLVVDAPPAAVAAPPAPNPIPTLDLLGDAA